ncbi:MAG: lysophospholipid acyltransferase family protein [Verrucomicrobia bacterium]|nr:lysophospholipid acyltransferase family protein [Verrucomicrobiota bacterium]
MPDSAANSPKSPRTASGGKVIIPEKPGALRAAAAALLYWTARAADLTFRYELRDPHEAMATVAAGPVIFSIWHNRLAVTPGMYRRFLLPLCRGSERRLAAMVSASRDGALLARALERFGIIPVRGSTSRRGPQALLEMTSWVAKGCDLALTPDGPRGPRYVIQNGPIWAAQLTGLPIVPLSAYIRWKRELSSWDRFQVPLPFSRIELQLGRPLRVPRRASKPEREARRRELEAEMRRITRD